MKSKTISLLFTLAVSTLHAEINMPEVFSDNMVLQRRMPVKLWGSADANAKVDAEFAGQKKSTTADSKGKWVLYLDSLKASTKPREIQILENGKLAKTIKNVLVGEVWIASGQSNMEMPMGALRHKVDISGLENPLVRCFKQKTFSISNTPREHSEEGVWVSAAPKNENPAFDKQDNGWGGKSDDIPYRHLSATGYYFANTLANNLKVPVAILYAAKGGTSMCAWIPEFAMQRLPYLKSRFEKFEKDLAADDYKKRRAIYDEKIAKHKAAVAKAKAEGKTPPKLAWRDTLVPTPETPWSIFDSPACDYNSKIHPIATFTARGVIWYQGEANVSNYTGPFEEQYKVLVDSWREIWDNPKMPFICVQLTSFGTNADWPTTRVHQLNVANSLNDSYIINTIDLGEKDDIHPTDKKYVGERLGKMALNKVYGKKIDVVYPEFASANYMDNGVEVKFTTKAKLVGKGEPRGFEIKINGKWIDAKPELSGKDTVFIASTSGKPEGVRYLWKSWASPEAWLFNKSNLPAYSFKDEK